MRPSRLQGYCNTLLFIHIISFISSKNPFWKTHPFPQPTVWLCGPPELSECDFCFRIVAQHVAKPAEHFGNSGRKELQVRRSQFSKSSAGRKTGTLLWQNELVAQSHTVQSLLCHTCQESGGTCTPSLCTRLLGMESSTLHNTKSDCKQRDPEARNWLKKRPLQAHSSLIITHPTSSSFCTSKRIVLQIQGVH